MYVYVHVCIMYVCIRMYACMYLRTYACYVSMNVCMYECIYVWMDGCVYVCITPGHQTNAYVSIKICINACTRARLYVKALKCM